ncbi:hypothetical protein ALC57_01158 [Trachymyrmex cornetzi]|uniref:Uncharacterized protein n=1 Tax=Trachymyrmex cornetzi TaxID=471704 RepID=A0A151JQX5_9HYME|nr:hypothetical protein ALC57_01158 [Trachymyrmex cornetzi]
MSDPCADGFVRNQVGVQTDPWAIGSCAIRSVCKRVRTQSGPCAIESVRNRVRAQSGRCANGSVCNRVVSNRVCVQRGPCAIGSVCNRVVRNRVRAQSDQCANGSVYNWVVRNWVCAQSGPCPIRKSFRVRLLMCAIGTLTDVLECRISSLRHSLPNRQVYRRVGLVLSVSLRKPFVYLHGNAFIVDFNT